MEAILSILESLDPRLQHSRDNTTLLRHDTVPHGPPPIPHPPCFAQVARLREAHAHVEDKLNGKSHELDKTFQKFTQLAGRKRLTEDERAEEARLIDKRVNAAVTSQLHTFERSMKDKELEVTDANSDPLS